MIEEEDVKKSEVVFQILKDAEYSAHVPEPQEVLKLLVRAMQVGSNQDMIYAMAYLVRNKGIIHMHDQLYELLSHEIASVREGILLLIVCCGHERGATIYSSKRFMEKYFSLALDENIEVRRCAFRMLHKGGENIMNIESVDRLLEMLRLLPNDKSTKDAISLINYILESDSIPTQIEEKYKKVLDGKLKEIENT